MVASVIRSPRGGYGLPGGVENFQMGEQTPISSSDDVQPTWLRERLENPPLIWSTGPQNRARRGGGSGHRPADGFIVFFSKQLSRPSGRSPKSPTYLVFLPKYHQKFSPPSGGEFGPLILDQACFCLFFAFWRRRRKC